MRQYFTDRDDDKCYMIEAPPTNPTFAKFMYVTGGAKGKSSWQLKSNMKPVTDSTDKAREALIDFIKPNHCFDDYIRDKLAGDFVYTLMKTINAIKKD